MVEGKDGKLVYKIFIVNTVSIHLSAPENSDLFKSHGQASLGGAYGLSYSWGLAQVGDKAQRWGVQKCVDTILNILPGTSLSGVLKAAR